MDGCCNAVRSYRRIQGISLVAYRSCIRAGVDVSTPSCGRCLRHLAVAVIVDWVQLMKHLYCAHNHVFW